MFEQFTPFDISVEQDVTIHGIHGGSGPALLLLHGFPQTHHIWHCVADELTKSYYVVAIDLRGYGRSSKPDGGEGHVQYGKKAMAQDAVRVMDELLKRRDGNDSSFYICAHDRGARVTHRLCVDYPHLVKKVILLDICPTLAMYTQTTQEFAQSYFHWFFLIQQSPLPEISILTNPQVWVESFMGGRYAGLAPFEEECLKEYKANLADYETVHAMCEDYRASASVDLREAEEDVAEGKCFDPLEEWRKVSSQSVDGKAVDSGHYIPEERPEEVIANVLEFFK
ncbi:epoxide hydrolase, putative [Talaromyces stipitatus ATCC 10500]|uniref:Epoxide hydrolase, putative n=1 Tax=Talaromyces stipitatus (strain ATCC 10500 / CBS 375.48 / QM 6759 / NRRL 1006) TaxID=441959 RepID=B8LT59_TALSN|nr:epoxide hydrolase, putative [Talaromyces stipitatus ATCC 10500]EED23567.1 epoxide hydrolase, putative [Talaromyces stipitatus ATCC 10500]